MNIPASNALCRSYLAYLRGDAEATAVFAARALAGLVTASRLLGSVAQDRPGQALTLLDRLYEAAAAQDRTGSLIEVGRYGRWRWQPQVMQTARWPRWPKRSSWPARRAMYAFSWTRARQWPRCWQADRRPAGWAGRRGGPAELPGPAPARVRRGARRASGSRRGTFAVPGLVDPLTGRELEVLGMLAAGKSNQAIAAEFVVTLNTVKKHVSHVLGKLGAGNRTEAVARARELGLIP